MVRLIDADAIEHCLVIGGRRHGKTIISEIIRRAIQTAPTVDAEPVRHGAWRHYERMLTCSECGTVFYDDIMEYFGDEVPRYCPECGAKMDAERKEE